MRRHRITETEVKPVMRAVHARLSQLVKEGKLTDDVENLFTVLWRFHQHRTGPPSYPEITLDAVRSLLAEAEPHLFT
jgi:hypothetical protein